MANPAGTGDLAGVVVKGTGIVVAMTVVAKGVISCVIRGAGLCSRIMNTVDRDDVLVRLKLRCIDIERPAVVSPLAGNNGRGAG